MIGKYDEKKCFDYENGFYLTTEAYRMGNILAHYELYKKIVQLREEFKKIELTSTWTNLTIKIEGIKFKVEYDYEDLSKSRFSSYERHIIWRYNVLGIKLEQLNRKERDILETYLIGEKVIRRRERYEESIYIKNIKNIVDYDTGNYLYEQNIEYIATGDEKVRNQIIMSTEQMEELKK